jgi:hypothetical protein
MEITLTLLPGAPPFTNKELLEIHAGVIDGWSKLSDDVKAFVEWTGIGFHPTDGIVTEVKVVNAAAQKNNTSGVTRTSRFFYLRGGPPPKTREEAEEKFTKTVRGLLHEMAESYQKNSEKIKKTLAAQP